MGHYMNRESKGSFSVYLSSLEVLRGSDHQMMRYTAGVRWQDEGTSEEVAMRCDIKEMEVTLRHRRLQ